MLCVLMGSSLYKKWRDAPEAFSLCSRGAPYACTHTVRASNTTALTLQWFPVITRTLGHGPPLTQDVTHVSEVA